MNRKITLILKYMYYEILKEHITLLKKKFLKHLIILHPY